MRLAKDSFVTARGMIHGTEDRYDGESLRGSTPKVRTGASTTGGMNLIDAPVLNPFLGLAHEAICYRRFATQESAQLLNSRCGLLFQRAANKVPTVGMPRDGGYTPAALNLTAEANHHGKRTHSCSVLSGPLFHCLSC